MNPAEYEIMFNVETEHWWYKNLHMMIDEAINNSMATNHERILDAGCGTGAVVERIASRHLVTGLDFSPLALQFTRRRVSVNLARGSVAGLPFKSGTFGAVVSLDVISHVDAGPAADSMAELARVLRPGGLLILNVPAFAWMRSPHDVQVRTGHRFTRGEILALFSGAGLRTEYCTYWNTLLMPAIIGARIVKRIVRSQSSDLTHYGPGIGARVCSAVLAVERRLLRMGPLPVGVSLFAIARKPE